MRKFIIDTDTASDDAAAIIMAALDPEIELLGVTSVAGNVSIEQATRNALQLLNRVTALQASFLVQHVRCFVNITKQSVFMEKMVWEIAI